MEDIGCKRQEGAKGMFVGLGLGWAGDEAEAEEFVGVREVVSSQEDSGIGLGPVFRKKSKPSEIFNMYKAANNSFASSLPGAADAALLGAKIPSPM